MFVQFVEEKSKPRINKDCDSNAMLGYEPGEMLKRPVVSALRFRGETTCRELPAIEVIAQAIAACAFFQTRFIAAVAVLHVLFLLTFHSSDSLLEFET
jgi:hypothetical protein